MTGLTTTVIPGSQAKDTSLFAAISLVNRDAWIKTHQFPLMDERGFHDIVSSEEYQ